jgi:hypothetical protein
MTDPADDSSTPPILSYARPGAGNPAGDLVTIATFGQSWEAHLAAGKLEANGIATILVGENFNNMGYANLGSGIKLQVPATHAAQARELLPQRVRTHVAPCPRCQSTDTRRIDFSPGVTILFFLLLGLPYLFITRPRICLDCGHVWKPTS